MQIYEPETFREKNSTEISTDEAIATAAAKSTEKKDSSLKNEIRSEPMSNTKRTHRERTRVREKEKWRMRQRKCHTLVFCIGIDDADDDDAVIIVVVSVVHKRSNELAEVNSLDTILNTKKIR